MNVTLILDTLRLRAPISRAALAAATGLNKASVSNMVRYLIALGYVSEIGAGDAASEVGRPAINLQLNPDAGYIISAEIGVNDITVLVSNFAFDVVMRRFESLSSLDGQEERLEYCIALLDDVYSRLQQRDRPIFGLAVGLPGLVDMSSGRLLFAPNLQWHDVPVRDRLRARFDVPVVVANEANMAALGESYFRGGRQSRLLLFVSSGVGLGGGIVVDGHLLTGINGLAGEFGHMTVDPTGPACRCGNIGCWETYATLGALFRGAREAIAAGQRSCLSRYGDMLTLERMMDAAEKGDAVALDAFQTTARWLGLGLANLVNMLNPQHVVFGGSLSVAHELLMPTMRAEIERRALAWIWDQVEFTTATYTSDAAVMGGVAMVHRHIIRQPITWQTQAEYDLS